MNLGTESETLEFKKTTGEVDKAMDNIASMLNKHGHGTLYFGVSPNGNVTGQQISASSLNDVARKIKDAIKPMIYPEIKEEILDGKSVIRVDFAGSEKPYSSFGRYYKRVFDRTEEMTPDELKRMMSETDSQSYWENNLTNFGLEAVDTEAVQVFYKKAVACGRIEEMPLYNTKDLLIGLGLLENNKLTNAGYYLFSNRKPVVLKLAVYVTDERINFADIARVEDNIFNLIIKRLLEKEIVVMPNILPKLCQRVRYARLMKRRRVLPIPFADSLLRIKRAHLQTGGAHLFVSTPFHGDHNPVFGYGSCAEGVCFLCSTDYECEVV